MKRVIYLLLFGVVLLAGLLRFYDISNNPPGLYLDEVSIGLNAYDILKTGKDQAGISYPLAFATFGEYKLPIYIYSTSLSMAIFGKNEFAIRFPSALTGTLTVLLFFFLIRELFLVDKKTSDKADIFGLLGALLLTITPWHIHFSRAGFEATEGLFFYTLALFLGIRFWKTNKLWYVLIASISVILAFYTYDAYRLLVPLTAAVSIVVFWMKKEYRKHVAISAILLILLALPMVWFSFLNGGLARLSQTSAFAENPFEKGYQKYVADGVIYLHNYFSYFSLDYLFRFGDQINRHQVHNLGILYLWELPFLISGFYFFTKTSNRFLRWIVLFLLLLGPIPAALARPSPHTLRNLFSVIPFTMLAVVGIYQLILQKGTWVKPLLVILSIIVAVEFGYYLHYYYYHYAKEALLDWGGSCKEVAAEMAKQAPNYQHIVVDNNTGCVSEYFAFYVPQVKFIRVQSTWKKPKNWGKTLYIRPSYGDAHPKNLLITIYLPNVNHDMFAQFFSL